MIAKCGASAAVIDLARKAAASATPMSSHKAALLRRRKAVVGAVGAIASANSAVESVMICWRVEKLVRVGTCRRVVSAA